METQMGEGSFNTKTTQGMELLALYRITELIGNAVQLDRSLNSILQVLNDTLKMERSTLLLYDKKQKKLVIKASCGLSKEEQLRGTYRPNEGVCGKIFQTRSPFVVPDVHSEPLFLNRTRARPHFTKKTLSFLGVPVMVKGNPEGVLTVDRLFGNDVSFEEDIRFLSILATLIAQFITLHIEIEKKEAKLIEENELLKARLHRVHRGHFIIGNSKPMQEVFSIINKISNSGATALLLGESGTGKELVATAIHESGKRHAKPLIKVNCAALPEALLESELFGHERGAFTGAHTSRPGRFELAAGGTLFLDEVGELPLSLQAKMLRILQERQFERVGGTKTLSVDVRIIAATNVSLEQAVAKGNFRSDLYYRLNVIPIILPPLRQRVDDIPLLINHFLAKSNDINTKNIRITSELLDFFIGYAWPGNVREMQNLIERMVILAEGESLMITDLPPEVYSIEPARGGLESPSMSTEKSETATLQGQSSLEDIERSEILASLKRNGWVQVRAAKELGLTQRQIGYRIKKYGLSRFDTYR